jgi:hypothetical protein
MKRAMSAIGPKRTSLVAPHMSALGGKADIGRCRQPRKHVSIFSIDYHVDPLRQSIADTVPHSLDASVARQDRNFSPWYDLAAMMADMRERLGARINARKIGA